MLKAVPMSWFSWNYEVADEAGMPVARLWIAPMRTKGTIEAGGFEYSVARDGLAGPFLLEKSGVLEARAEKPRALYRSFDIQSGGRSFVLKARYTLRREFVLTENGIDLGTIAPEGALTRRARIDLPDDLPLPLRLFAAWLTIFLWKRAAQSDHPAGFDAGAAAAGSSGM